MKTFVAEHQPECGPGEIWWILNTQTQMYTDDLFTNQQEAEAKADELNKLKEA